MPDRPTNCKQDYSLPLGEANYQGEKTCNQHILGGLFSQNDGDMSAAVKLEGTLGRQIPNL